ncbi:MAG: glycosyltransferase family 4 protein [Planctomycetota bacterium]
MRVLLINEACNTGVGRHVLDLAEGLLKHDCAVDLVYSTRRMDDVFADRLRRLPEVRAAALDMRRSPAPSDLAVARRTRAIVRDGRRDGRPFDVVHGHSTKGGIIARMTRRAAGTGPAVVYTPNGVYSMNPELSAFARWGVALIERHYARRTDAIIAVSPYERDHLRDIGIADDRVRVIPNGIPPMDWASRADARRRFGFDGDETVVGFVGRLSPQKNPELLVDACGSIFRDHPQARLAIVGEGPRESACRERGEQWQLGDRVRWLGFQTAEAAMPAFDVFVMPSRYEGMPYVLMEAMCLGLPIVATDVGGTRLAVEHGENGLVVEPGNPAALAEALASVLADDAFRERLGAASRERSARFTADEMVRSTVALYRDLTRLEP